VRPRQAAGLVLLGILLLSATPVADAATVNGAGRLTGLPFQTKIVFTSGGAYYLFRLNPSGTGMEYQASCSLGCWGPGVRIKAFGTITDAGQCSFAYSSAFNLIAGACATAFATSNKVILWEASTVRGITQIATHEFTAIYNRPVSPSIQIAAKDMIWVAFGSTRSGVSYVEVHRYNVTSGNDRRFFTLDTHDSVNIWSADILHPANGDFVVIAGVVSGAPGILNITSTTNGGKDWTTGVVVGSRTSSPELGLSELAATTDASTSYIYIAGYNYYTSEIGILKYSGSSGMITNGWRDVAYDAYKPVDPMISALVHNGYTDVALAWTTSTGLEGVCDTCHFYFAKSTAGMGDWFSGGLGTIYGIPGTPVPLQGTATIMSPLQTIDGCSDFGCAGLVYETNSSTILTAQAGT